MPPWRCSASRSAIASPPARDIRSRGASSRFETITSRVKPPSPLLSNPSRACPLGRLGKQAREPTPRLARALDPQAAWGRLGRSDLNGDASARENLVKRVFVGVVVAHVNRHAPRERSAFRELCDGGALVARR